MDIKQTLSNLLGLKAYDPMIEGTGNSITRYYLSRRSLNVNSPEALLEAYAQHELAYACINKIADVMNDAEIIVEKMVGSGSDAKWEPVEGHPLPSLFKKPNPHETGRDFRRLMVISEYAAGIFYGEVLRSSAGLPVEIYALNPNKVIPILNKSSNAVLRYEYLHSDGTRHNIKPENMLIRRRVDLVNRFYGLSPLAVALKTVNSDIALTDYVDAFFESDGTPSGILKILNLTVPDSKKEALQAQWRRKYSRGGTNHKGLAVLDQNADYQSIGAKLNELDSASISDRFESRICSVFGVPPILVGALTGLRYTTANATAKSALNDFWDNKVSPDLSQLREWLTWFILPEYEDIEAIKADKIRVGYDISHVAFLQEDQDAMHERARENFKAGLMMLNEARESIGLPPDDSAKGQDYYIMPSTFVALTPERRLEEAEEEPEEAPDPLQLTNGNGNGNAVNLPAVADEEEGKKAGYRALADIMDRKPLSFPAKPVKVAENVEQVVLEGITALEPETKKLMVEYEGLSLRREPDHLEKLCDLKSMVNEHELNEERVTKILKRFRVILIDQAVVKMDRRTMANAHMIVLESDPKSSKEIAKAMRNSYATGQNQVARELMNQKRERKIETLRLEVKQLDEDDLAYIEGLSDGLVGRMINEIRTRAVNRFMELMTLGSYTKELLKEVLMEQSEKWIDPLAGASVNAAIQSGREDEASERKDEWGNVQYSAILDANTCSYCEEADGMEASDPDDLPDAPNPECEGQANCRCFHVYVAA